MSTPDCKKQNSLMKMRMPGTSTVRFKEQNETKNTIGLLLC